MIFMSLTSRIQALTAYANEVTGKSDSTLSDAVASLADGYGGGGGYDGIEIVTGANDSIEYICHMQELPPYALNFVGYNNTAVNRVIRFATKPTKIKAGALREVRALIDWTGLTEVETIEGEYSLTPFYSSKYDGSSDIVNLLKFTGATNSATAAGLFRTNSPYAPKTFILPLCTVIPQYAWYQYTVQNVDITIGSVGHGVTQSNSQPFGYTTNATGTVTIYTTGDILDALKTTVQQNAGSGLTFIYKASEVTTYNGTSYSAGDTILTSTPS